MLSLIGQTIRLIGQTKVNLLHIVMALKVGLELPAQPTQTLYPLHIRGFTQTGLTTLATWTACYMS